MDNEELRLRKHLENALRLGEVTDEEAIANYINDVIDYGDIGEDDESPYATYLRYSGPEILQDFMLYQQARGCGTWVVDGR